MAQQPVTPVDGVEAQPVAAQQDDDELPWGHPDIVTRLDITTNEQYILYRFKNAVFYQKIYAMAPDMHITTRQEWWITTLPFLKYKLQLTTTT